MRTRFALGLASVLAAWATQAAAETVVLPYQGSNQWVAQTDMAPLKKVLRAARQGTTEFRVTLPSGKNRALSLKRLDVIEKLITRDTTTHGPLLIETPGTTPPNTLTIQW